MAERTKRRAQALPVLFGDIASDRAASAIDALAGWTQAGPASILRAGEEEVLVKRIFTIGYEGASLADFVATLKRAKISVLVDIRELPLSRRRGFSKKALCEAVTSQGIKYQHEKLLGSPRSLRHQLRRDGDYRSFFRSYRKHLSTQQEVMEELANALRGNIALVCYERDHRDCHRSVVAEAFSGFSTMAPVHLEVTSHRVSRKAPKATYTDTRQGISTA